MTNTTPEVEEIVEEFESRYSYLYQGTVYENEHNFSPVHESVKHWLRTTLEEVRREERDLTIQHLSSIIDDNDTRNKVLSYLQSK